METILLPIKRFWRFLRGSLTFVPSIWVLAAIATAVLFRYLEGQGLSSWLGERSDFWIISDPDTARTILSTAIGGVISLTVFSFSMVMVVLGQATNSLSPRLLPQLIRDRSHQTVLGVYLGVIVFSCLALMADNPKDEYASNSFTIFCCVILVIVCLGFFVYFIASISRRIQVGVVIRDVHDEALEKIERWQKGVSGWSVRALPAGCTTWHPVIAKRSGYVDITIYEELSHLAGELDTRLYLQAPRNAYVQKGTILFRSERPLTNEERELVIRAVNLNTERDGELYYLTAMKHIQEVAIKALSPGINDPGTAVEAINLLGDLFCQLLTVPHYTLYKIDKDNCGEVYCARYSSAEALHRVFQSIRVYAREDPMVMATLVKCLQTLTEVTDQEDFLAAVQKEKAALREDGEQQFTNQYDREEFLELFATPR